ncbi:MAG: glycosyltransferase family 1 protein [Pseudomonadota bacterium]|nr:glycosyltransferase family 1 protein [Pseudomonadota bacterium]
MIESGRSMVLDKAMGEKGISLLIDGLPLAPPLSGVGYYTHHLGRELEGHPSIQQVSYWGHLGVGSRADLDGEFSVLQSGRRRLSRYYGLLRAVRPGALFRQLQLRSSLAKHYLFHETNFVLRPYDGPSVTTIHDLSFRHFPQFHPPERVRHMEEGLPETVRRVRHVITVSEFVRRELIETLSLAPEMVTAIPLGVDPDFRPREQEDLLPRLGRYGLADRAFVLILGNFEPRKNIGRLVEAYERLPPSVGGGVVLAHAGPEGWQNRELLARVERLESQGRFARLGYVPREDLPLLVSAARVFAFPSIYEGFGLPPLEAMASGVPVLASNRASIPEVVGDAALLVEPEDVDAMTQALERLLTDDALRHRLRARGLERAARFTWAQTADRTVNVYRKVLDAL